MNKLQEYLDALLGRIGDEGFALGEKSLKKSTLVRVLTLIAVVFLGYLVGLVAEFFNNFAQYQASGGMVGGQMPKMNYAPYEAFGNLFTANGLKSFFGILIFTVVLTLLLKYHDKIFGGGDMDERGFRKTKEGTYGTADWISEEDTKKILEIGSVSSVEGTILGEKKGKVYCMPTDTRFNRHIMVFGASGTMKSRAIIRNHIMQCIKRGESCAITDPKGEMFRDTYELFKQNGYNVKVYNLVNPEHGNTWNCMGDLHGDTLLAQVLTNIIIGNTSSGKGDHFWDNGEGNLLKALILYVDNSEEIPRENKNLATVYKELTSKGEKELMRMFDKLPPQHPAKAPYNLFAQASDQVKSGIVLGLGTRLQILQNEAVSKMVATSDIDLESLAKEKSAFFVILSDQDTTMKFLSSLFFSLLFIKLTRYADSQPNQKCTIPVNLILDEFNNIGRIGGAEDGSDFTRTLSVIRSRDVRIMIAVQSLGQLQNRYANNLWAEIIGNCDIQLMLGCTDDLTAEYISERSGEMSIQVNSTRRSKRTFALFEVIPQYQETEGQGKRKLLTKDEVLTMDPQELLIILRGYNLLKLNKFDYTKNPMSKQMRAVNLQDYYASGVDYASVERKEQMEQESASNSEHTENTNEASSEANNHSLEWMLAGVNDVNSQKRVCIDDEVNSIAQHTDIANSNAGIPATGTPSDEYVRWQNGEFGQKSSKTDTQKTRENTTAYETQHTETQTESKVPVKPRKGPGDSLNNPIRVSKDGTQLHGF